MDASLLTIVVAVIVSIVSPSLLAFLTTRSRRVDKLQDWAREDAVAQALADENDRKKERDKLTAAKLETIHELVNAGFTAAKQSEYDALVLYLALLKETVGTNPTTRESLGAIAATESKIAELRVILDDRQSQQRRIDAQQSLKGKL